MALLLDIEGSVDEPESVLGMWQVLREEFNVKDSIVPFAIDGGGNLTCFDFSSQPEPTIVYWQHDSACLPIKIAQSFEAFIDLLE